MKHILTTIILFIAAIAIIASARENVWPEYPLTVISFNDTEFYIMSSGPPVVTEPFNEIKERMIGNFQYSRTRSPSILIIKDSSLGEYFQEAVAEWKKLFDVIVTDDTVIAVIWYPSDDVKITFGPDQSKNKDLMEKYCDEFNKYISLHRNTMEAKKMNTNVMAKEGIK